MSEEKKPSIVRNVIRDLKYNSEQLEADLQKQLGRQLYYNKVAARLQEALADSTLAIFDVDEDIEYRVVETASLVNLRLSGLQGRTNATLAGFYDIWMEILAEEWVPLLKACRVAERRIKLRGSKTFVREGLRFIQDIKDTYGAVHVVPWGFKLLARSFGSEFEVVQWVALLQNFSQESGARTVQIGGSGGTD